MKSILISLGGLVATVTLATITLWIAGYQVAAAALGAFTVSMWLLVIILLSIALGSWWTLKVEDKAAARQQAAIKQNDDFDAKKTQAMATLLREGVRLGASNAPRLPGGAPPPFDLPPVENWLQLPQETDFIEGELGD